jgi:hypothetical protein
VLFRSCKTGIINSIKTILSNHVKVEFHGGGSYQKYIKRAKKFLEFMEYIKEFESFI